MRSVMTMGGRTRRSHSFSDSTCSKSGMTPPPDEQLLDQLEYNLQWQYALGIDSSMAHTCQKTLHNFRKPLMANNRAQKEFEKVTLSLAKADGVGLSRQRLDSTHVLSNIAVLTRLGLFVETVTHFLRELRREDPDAFDSLDQGYARRYLDRDAWNTSATPSASRHGVGCRWWPRMCTRSSAPSRPMPRCA